MATNPRKTGTTRNRSNKPKKLTVKAFDDEWVPHHDSLYVGFAAWMENNAAAKFEWFNALQEFTLDELKQASRVHFRLPNGSKAENYSRMLADILDLCKKARVVQTFETNFATGGKRCGMCRGYGLVSAIALPGHSFKSIGGHDLQECSVACKCEKGIKFADRFWTFDENTMEPWDVRNAIDRTERVDAIIQSVVDSGNFVRATVLRDFLEGKYTPRELLADPRKGFGLVSDRPAGLIAAPPTRSVGSPVLGWDGDPIAPATIPEAQVDEFDEFDDLEDDPVAGLGPNDPPPDDEVPF